MTGLTLFLATLLPAAEPPIGGVPAPAMFAGGIIVEDEPGKDAVVCLAVPWGGNWKNLRGADRYVLLFASREAHDKAMKWHHKAVRVGGRIGHGSLERYILVTWMNEDTRDE